MVALPAVALGTSPVSPVLGSVQQIADAAFVYVAARQATKDAERVEMNAVARVDAALHDLTLVCGFPCECSEGCEGLIL